MFKFWKKALRKTFGLEVGKTTHTLGQWLRNNMNTWTWFYNPNSNSIMQRFGRVWNMWKRESNRGHMGCNSKFQYLTTRTRIPASVKKATITWYAHNRIKLTGWVESQQDSTQTYSHSVEIKHFPLNTQQNK